MFSTQPAPLTYTSDRLGLTLFLAAALHVMVIAGVTFTLEERIRQDLSPTLEVTLVHSRSDEAPKEAEYLAQVNQKGGGTMQEKLRPSSPFPNRRPVPDERGHAPQELQPVSPPPQPEVKRTQVLMADESSQSVEASPPIQEAFEPQLPETAALIASSLAIARLSAEIRAHQQSYASLPREKVITANTREYKFATYEESWRQKVERIGNLNYPEDARRQSVAGNLLLAASIKPDGSLDTVEVRRSSGYKMLDEAAIRIVRMAAPYAPFPESFQLDRLVIIRTWQFENSALTSR